MNEQTPFGSYVIRDSRGINPDRIPDPVCRVCGASEQHTNQYNQPTMDCIKYLRSEIARLVKEFA